MSLCRTQFFFIRNSSILNAGLKQSTFNKLLSSSVQRSNTNNSLNFIKSLIPSSKHSQKINFTTTPSSSSPLRSQSSSISSQKRLFSTSLRSRNVAAVAPHLNTSAENILKPVSSKAKSSWPINSHKNVGYLCIGTSILVFAIVILGGLTRLTESGLSITEWKPVAGAIPPLNQEEWEEEFNKYKESPEFKQLNAHLTLEEFKFIFGMEWSHRLLGRIIGTVFVLPTLYYIARRKVSLRTAGKLLGICGLIGLQGAIGWWMVYSGIDTQQLEERRSKPTVSQYRLAAHLGAAFLVYFAMISTGFSVLRNQKILKNPEAYLKAFQQLQSPITKRYKVLSGGLFALTFFTAMTGAFVAGLDAGLIYNTFPRMGEDWIPSNRELFSPLFSRLVDQSDLFWRNCLENPTTVQLIHRIFAMTTFGAVLAMHLYAHRIKPVLPRQAYKWSNVMMGLVTVQLGLGIFTLIYIVPTELGAAHQAGALALLTGVLLLVNNLKKPSKANLMILKNALAQVQKQAVKNSAVLK